VFETKLPLRVIADNNGKASCKSSREIVNDNPVGFASEKVFKFMLDI
jgi:hypothetical protein